MDYYGSHEYISGSKIPTDKVKRTVINRKTGEIIISPFISADKQLTNREKEILLLISEGFLSKEKEIADRLHLSIYTINNHRKNILSELGANNAIEALNFAKNSRLVG